MTSYNSQTGPDGYKIQFETDDEEHYKYVQRAIRECIYSGLRDLNERDIEVVLVYADTNMNLSKTSRECFCHPNTTRYHLQRVKEVTGLDPQCFHDLVKLVDAVGRGRTDDN